MKGGAKVNEPAPAKYCRRYGGEDARGERRPMDIRITSEDDVAATPQESLLRLAEKALRLEHAPERAELSLALVGAERMAALNRDYLEREGPTDVLAFPLDEEREGEGEILLGDVVICPEVVFARREMYDVDEGDEVGYAMVHGILHLLGYDHASDAANEAMDERVRTILAAEKGE